MHKKILFLGFLILLVTPLAYAETYGAGTYGADLYGIGEVITPPPPPGGGGGSAVLECTQDSDCGTDQYCFQNKCYAFECVVNSQCTGEDSCWNGRCVKLFDIEILDFESPLKLGEFFEFTYLMVGMADINDDVEILFWIEKDGKIITEGKDTLFFKSFEEKIKTKKLFLPSDIDSGDYTFFLQVKYGTYTAESLRTIEIKVGEGMAEITLLPEISRLKIYVISILIILAILIVLFIFYLEIRKIRNEIIIERKWISNHKISILVFCLFVILAIPSYYLNLFGKISIWASKVILWSKTNILPYLVFILAVVIVVIVFVIIRVIIKKQEFFDKLKVRWEDRNSE